MFQFQPQQQKPAKKPWVKVQPFNPYGPTQVIFEVNSEAAKFAKSMILALEGAGIKVRELRTPMGYSLYINEENYKELISSLNSAGLEVFYVL
jgi:hypothetical protein